MDKEIQISVIRDTLSTDPYFISKLTFGREIADGEIELRKKCIGCTLYIFTKCTGIRSEFGLASLEIEKVDVGKPFNTIFYGAQTPCGISKSGCTPVDFLERKGTINLDITD